MICEHCGAAMAYKTLSGVFICPACGYVTLGNLDDAIRIDALAMAKLALMFYANEGNYQGEMLILADGGQLARESLSRIW